MLTKKYYQDFARILSKTTDQKIIDAFCEYFRLDNSRFDVDRFLQAIEKNRLSKAV